MREFDRAYRGRRVSSALIRAATALAIALVSLALCAPQLWLPGLALAVALLTLGAVLGFVRLRLDPEEVDRELGLGGRLRTWWDARQRRGTGGAMFGWLERDLAARLALVPAAATRRIGRRRLAPLRSALLVLLALLLLRLLVLPDLPDGVLPLAGLPSASAADSQAPGAGPAPTSAAGDPTEAGPEEAEPEDPPAAGAAPPEADPTQDPESGPPPELPPEALILDPPVQDEVVVPAFVGEGEGRKTTATAAGLDEARPDPGGPSGAGSGRAPQAGPPEPPDPTAAFERAAESALRSRHVPLEERAFVRRWFRADTERRR